VVEQGAASGEDCSCPWSVLFMHELVLFVAIPFVGCVDNLVVAFFALHQVLAPHPAPLRLQRTCELYPFACELISVLGGLPCV